MKKYYYLLFLFLFIPLISFAQNWQKTKISSWDFEISIPENYQKVIDNDACVLIGKSDKTKFQVIVKKNQVNEANVLINESMAGFVDENSDKILNNQNIKVDNYPAKELKLTTSKGKNVVMRIIIAKNKTFMLIVSATQIDEEDMKTFFNSFSVE